MAKVSKQKKERAEKYEEKVSFDGTFEDMIGISVKQAEKKVTKAKEPKPIEYRDWRGRNCLVLKRDWSKVKKGDLPKSDKCPFCGKRHIHGGSDGHRVAHCEDPTKTCIADDGTVLNASDGYYIESYNRKD